MPQPLLPVSVVTSIGAVVFSAQASVAQDYPGPKPARLNLHYAAELTEHVITYRARSHTLVRETGEVTYTICDIKPLLSINPDVPFEPPTNEEGCLVVAVRLGVDSLHLIDNHRYILFYTRHKLAPGVPDRSWEPNRYNTFRVLTKHGRSFVFGGSYRPVMKFRANGEITLGDAKQLSRGMGRQANMRLPYTGLTVGQFIQKLKRFLATRDPSLKPLPPSCPN